MYSLLRCSNSKFIICACLLKIIWLLLLITYSSTRRCRTLHSSFISKDHHQKESFILLYWAASWFVCNMWLFPCCEYNAHTLYPAFFITYHHRESVQLMKFLMCAVVRSETLNKILIRKDIYGTRFTKNWHILSYAYAFTLLRHALFHADWSVNCAKHISFLGLHLMMKSCRWKDLNLFKIMFWVIHNP